MCIYRRVDIWGGSGTKSAVWWTECPHSDDQIQTQTRHFLERKNKRPQLLHRSTWDGIQLTRGGLHAALPFSNLDLQLIGQSLRSSVLLDGAMLSHGRWI